MEQDDLSIKDKVLVFLHLLERGIPPWYGEEVPMYIQQQRVFARLVGISEAEAESAFIECMTDGNADVDAPLE